MDTENYEQFTFSEEQLGEAVKFLKESMLISVLVHNGNTIGIELPNFVELAVEKTDPGVKGDTVSGATKRAVLETGAEVQVPLFVEEGDVIKIDTRSGEYIERI